MASIYDIDFDLQVVNLDVPTRRLSKFKAFMHSLVYPLQWLRDLFFNNYVNGSTYPLFSSYASSYVFSIGDRVIYSDRGVYECVVSVVASATTPLDANWIKVCDNFIGLSERMKYTSQIITFEYLMNKWFFNSTATTQIYIVNNAIQQNPFVMGVTGGYSSAMAVNSVYSTSYMATIPSFPIQYNFTIFVPLALFTTLGSSAINREKAIRAYADKYVIAGITYNVTTY